jgi:hypothetical protein
VWAGFYIFGLMVPLVIIWQKLFYMDPGESLPVALVALCVDGIMLSPFAFVLCSVASTLNYTAQHHLGAFVRARCVRASRALIRCFRHATHRHLSVHVHSAPLPLFECELDVCDSPNLQETFTVRTGGAGGGAGRGSGALAPRGRSPAAATGASSS